MANLTNFGEALLLKWLNTDESVTRPTAWYLGLCSTATDDAGGGTELTAAGYAREAIDFGTDGAANVGALEFTASEDWPEATHFFIADASTSGNRIWHGPLTAARQADDGDTLAVAIGAITCAFD